MAHCVISVIVDSDDGNSIIPACVVHASHAPCMDNGQPACPAPLHSFTSDRPGAVRAWALRTHRQRPLILHDDRRIPDPLDHVFEDEILPCPCGTEVLAAIGGVTA
jgi:hypothetical protein